MKLVEQLRTWLCGRAPQLNSSAAIHDTSSGAPWHPTHVHKKGGHYRVLGHGIQEADRTAATIYDDQDGTVWVRPTAEFEDGRFTPLT